MSLKEKPLSEENADIEAFNKLCLDLRNAVSSIRWGDKPDKKKALVRAHEIIHELTEL
jgi:flagellin-specific chaperone FliS